MEKEYNYFPEEPANNEVREPAIEYPTSNKTLPVITEEELAECITTEELLESVYAHIDKLFANKK